MQLYRGMDIGTAKLTSEERDGVPHHLLDIWDVTVTASVAEYQRLARERIDALLAEGRWPILVGGSGLYVRGAVDNLEFPGTDPEVRARLEEELALRGSGALHARLAAADPEAAHAILPSNAAVSSAPWRSSRSPASPSPPTSPATTRSTTPSRSASTWRARNSTSASRAGSTGCGARVSWTRCGSWRRAACARGSRRPARSATSRCSRRSRGVHGAGGARGDRACHQALRAPSGFVVQARSSGALVEWGCGGSHRTSAPGTGVGRTTGHSLITSWHRDAPAAVSASGGVPSSSFDRPSGVRVGRARGDGGRPSRDRRRH